jgi:hypothetical protein
MISGSAGRSPAPDFQVCPDPPAGLGRPAVRARPRLPRHRDSVGAAPLRSKTVAIPAGMAGRGMDWWTVPRSSFAPCRKRPHNPVAGRGQAGRRRVGPSFARNGRRGGNHIRGRPEAPPRWSGTGPKDPGNRTACSISKRPDNVALSLVVPFMDKCRESVAEWRKRVPDHPAPSGCPLRAARLNPPGGMRGRPVPLPAKRLVSVEQARSIIRNLCSWSFGGWSGRWRTWRLTSGRTRPRSCG